MAQSRRYAVVGLTALSSLLCAGSVQAATFFSEYVEGSSNNKALEIANTGPGSVDLSNCEILRYSNGSSTGFSIPLSGTISANSVHVICNTSFADPNSVCNEKNSNINFNGDDAVELRCNGTTLDVIGQIGFRPNGEWGTGDTSTKDNTLCRKASVTSGDSNGANAFDPSVEWVGLPLDTFGGLGNLDACEADPADDPITCSESVAPIGQIQGTGDSSPFVDQVRSVRGVVTAVLPKLEGFFIQNTGNDVDGNINSSDGIWVYNPAGVEVVPGNIYIVKGKVGEFAGRTQIALSVISPVCGSGSVTPVEVDGLEVDTWERYEGMLVRPRRNVTITNNYNLERYNELGVTGSNKVLRQATEIEEPGAAALAVEAENQSKYFVIDDLVNEQNLFPVICGGGLDPREGRFCRAGAKIAADSVQGPLDYSFGQFRIRDLDEFVRVVPGTDKRPLSNPVVGGADVRVGVFNVLNYFVTIDTNGAKCGPANIGCRGADSAQEFAKQAEKITKAIDKLGADVVALQELENPKAGVPFSQWAISDLVGRLNALSNPISCGDGDWVAVNPGGPLGTDAIQNGIIYCNRNLALEAVDVLDDSDLPGLGLSGLGDVFNGPSTNRVVLGAKFRDQANARSFTLVATHQKSKGSSSGFRKACREATNPGANCDQGDGAGYYNDMRNNASTAIREWLASSGNPIASDLELVVGDINAYGKEDPVRNFVTNGYTDLKTEAGGADSYVFGGRWGSLDRAMANAALAERVTGVNAWAISAEEPRAFDYNEEFKGSGSDREADAIATYYENDEFRASDHSPMLVGLCLREDCSTAPTLAAPALGGFGLATLGLGLFGIAGLRRRR